MRVPPEALPLPAALVEAASVLPDRDALLPKLPRRAVFAEVGVGLGDFSAAVLTACEPSLFIAIDDFRLHQLEQLWNQPTAVLFGGGTHSEFYRARFATPIAEGRMRVLEGDSADCLARLDPASVDVVYVDAGHLYDEVARDLSASLRVVRPDGWIVLNDYIMVAELGADHAYGVVHAAHEFMLRHGWGMQYLALQTRMFCDVALRPQALLRPAGTRADALAAEVAALRASTSWRVTAPLRAFSRALGVGR